MRRSELTPEQRLARHLDRTLLFSDAGLPPPHDGQRAMLQAGTRDVMSLMTRQGGKSSTAAVAAVAEFLFPVKPEFTPTVVCASPSERQSFELLRKIKDIYRALPYAPPLATDSASIVERAGGARIISLPGSEGTARGISGASLLLIDEAAAVPDDLRNALTPMCSTTGAPIWSMTTPRGCAGWFYDDWRDDDLDFVLRIKMTADEVPHLSREFLEKERKRMPKWQFRQEYYCEFVSPDATALITPEQWAQFLTPEVAPLW